MGRDSAHLPLYSSGYGGPPRRPGGGGKSGGGLSLQACLVGVLLLSTLGMAYVAVSMHTELGHLRRALGEREAALQERDTTAKRVQAQFDQRLDSMQKELDSKTQQVRAASEDASKAAGDLGQSHQELVALQAELSDARAALEAAKGEAKEAQRQAQRAQQQADLLTDEKAELTSQLAQQKKHAENAESELAVALKLADKYGAQLDQARTETTEVREQLEALRESKVQEARAMDAAEEVAAAREGSHEASAGKPHMQSELARKMGLDVAAQEEQQEVQDEDAAAEVMEPELGAAEMEEAQAMEQGAQEAELEPEDIAEAAEAAAAEAEAARHQHPSDLAMKLGMPGGGEERGAADDGDAAQEGQAAGDKPAHKLSDMEMKMGYSNVGADDVHGDYDL